MPDVVRRIFETLYTRAEVAGQYVAYDKLARLGLEFSLIDWAKVTFEAERLADQRVGGDYPMAVQGVWDYDFGAQATLVDYRGMPALVLPSKQGDIYILDRRTGKPLTPRSEEHTSELQSLMRTPYAVFCL